MHPMLRPLSLLLLAPLVGTGAVTHPGGIDTTEVTRMECFRIDWHESVAERPELRLEGAESMPLGLAVWRRREGGGRSQLEFELRFPREERRFMLVEDLNPRDPRLVWRELTGGAGRTLRAEWAPEAEQLLLREWAFDGSLRESHDTQSGVVFPLYLLELARSGQTTGGTFNVFDPVGRCLDAWNLQTSYSLDSGAGAAAPERRVEFRRADGSLAGRYHFRGDSLHSFQLQESALVSRRISEEEYRALTGE